MLWQYQNGPWRKRSLSRPDPLTSTPIWRQPLSLQVQLWILHSPNRAVRIYSYHSMFLPMQPYCRNKLQLLWVYPTVSLLHTSKELNCCKAESTQQILLANGSFIFMFQCYVKPCQIYSDSVHFSIFCITLPITFYVAFLTSVTLS